MITKSCKHLHEHTLASSQSKHQFSVRYFLACNARFFFPSLFSCIAGAVFTSPPHLCVKSHIFSVILGKSCVFFQATLISQTPPFSLSILHCFLRMECSISLQYFQHIHVRTAICSVCSLTNSWVCYPHIHTTHRKYFRLNDPEPINIHQLRLSSYTLLGVRSGLWQADKPRSRSFSIYLLTGYY